jgi:HK97 family phage major capsid protein
MRIWERALGAVAPAPAPAPRRTPRRVDRWTRSASFSINLPAEMTGDLTSSAAPAPRVSREQAIQVPAVKRVRDLIAGTLGTLDLCQLTKPGYREVFSALLEQPEDDIARSVTMTRTIEDMLFEGRAWWRIVGFGADGFPDRIVRLEADSVSVRQNGRVWVSSTSGAQGISIGFQPDELLIRIDSPNDAMLVAGARAIRAALLLGAAADRMADDPQPVGYVTPKADVELDPDFDVDEAMDDMEDARARRSWGYVGGALELHQLTWNPEQLQFMSQRDYAVLEIARVGGVDPEELGVSTTSRTYANSEQRRLDLIDFTCAAYVTAIQDRLSMRDVTQPGRRVYFEYDAFLRSDTPSRMDVYDKGRKVGAYDDERIARAERIPVARVRAAAQAAKPAPPASAPAAAAPVNDTEETVTSTLAPVGARFSAQADEVRFVFEVPESVAAFKADSVKRTISGMAVPWNVVARSGGYKWAFAPGSLHWSDAGRVKLDKDHGYGTEFGKATSLANAETGLLSSFKVARGTSGDDALGLAEDGVYDGLSIYVNFETEGDGWIPHPDDETVRYVQSATLRKVALTAMPAFDDARVQHVAATRNGAPNMTAPVTNPATAPVTQPNPQPAGPPPTPPAAFDAAAFAAQFTSGLTAALTEANKAMLADLIANLPAPQRQVIPAGRVQSVKEPLVYQMNGQGPSFVRDARRVMTGSDGDGEARARLRKYEAQTQELVEASMADPTFAINTGNAAAVIPPGYRPELYVSQLLKGRPLTNSVSRGTIADATPFTVPAFVSSSGATATHVEGVNPTEGGLTVGPVTITPGGISGLYKITREMADSANPAIDAIATQAMSESFSQQTEALVYAELNGTNGVGGTITAGFVPSGAQATAVTDSAATDQGRKFLAGIRTAIGVYDFRRFAEIDFGFLSQEGVSVFAGAVDSTGRPLVPWVNSMNPSGTMVQRGYDVDGVILQKAWSMSGNAAGDADVIAGNRNDAWVWESPVLSFRFEERSGPAFVELALFGYFAVRILRPVGLVGLRLTVS